MAQNSTLNLTHLTASKKNDGYSDGDIEDKLLAHFQQQEPDNTAFQTENPGWASTYHLSKSRENLLNWIDFKPGSTVLEVGAGCGALTGILSEKCASVTALELSERRATINATRHADKKNVEVVVGNLEDLQKRKNTQYDYVVCVGVLEYAGRFISGDKPFHTFLESLRTHTKKSGTLILAIENKLGLKYWSGAKEDHTHRYMEGIEGYPHYDGIRTFGKQELAALLTGAGFAAQSFYYPSPDYKMPHTVYSDGYLPGVHTPDIPSSFYPTPTPSQSRQQVLREQLAVRSVAQNGLYGDLANSFLVLASSSDPQQTTVFSHGSLERKPAFQTITRIQNQNGKLSAVKTPATPDAADHIQNMYTHYRKISEVKKVSVLKAQPTGAGMVFDFISSPSLESNLVDALLHDDRDTAITSILSFKGVLDAFPSRNASVDEDAEFEQIFGSRPDTRRRIFPGVIDLNLDNIKAEGDTLTIFDYEWLVECGLSKDFLLWRTLRYFFDAHGQIVRATTGPKNPCMELAQTLFVPEYLYEKFRTTFEKSKKYEALESGFQQHVGSDAHDRVDFHTKATKIDTELPDNVAESYEHTQALHGALQETTVQLQKELVEAEQLRAELADIKRSKAWRVVTKARNTRQKIRRPKKTKKS